MTRDELMDKVREYHHATEAEDMRPVWGYSFSRDDAAIPLCSHTCPLHDGKRCGALGLRMPEGLPCPPAVEAIVNVVLRATS